MEGFWFTPEPMDKVGVERRLLTAGVNKGDSSDPFSPQDPGQKAHAQGLLDDIHKAIHRRGQSRSRGKRLKETPEMFSGLVWTGAQSVELGLADDFWLGESVARDVVKAEKLFEVPSRTISPSGSRSVLALVP